MAMPMNPKPTTNRTSAPIVSSRSTASMVVLGAANIMATLPILRRARQAICSWMPRGGSGSARAARIGRSWPDGAPMATFPCGHGCNGGTTWKQQSGIMRIF
jgi:hypothetical protein